MTTHASLTSAKIGQIRDDFLRSETGRKLSTEDAARLRKFVTWCGVSTSAESVLPFKVEEFLQGQMNTSISPRTYIQVLRAFFQFAHQQEAIGSDPMKTVRLPRGAGGAVKKGITPTAAPRSSHPRESDAVYVSRAQHESMQAEIERLRTEERDKVSRLLHDAIKDGDISENAGYDDAKMRQGLLEARIRELESKLRNVLLIEDQDRSSGAIGVGSHVRLEEVSSGESIDYQVVGPDEANPRGGKISHRSPVGLAIIGMVPGNEVVVTTPGGAVRYKVVSVE